MASQWSVRAARLAALVAIVAAWHAIVAWGWISPFLIPSPESVAASFPVLLDEGGLAAKFLLTLGSAIAGTLIAAAIGIALGWLLYWRPVLGEAYESWFGAAFSAPLVLLYPLFMVVFGRGMGTVLVMSVIAGTIPVVLNTLQGLRGVPQVYVNVARGLHMTRAQLAFKVLLPGALPTIFTGVRLSLIYTMLYIVSLEYLVSVGGLGALIGDRYDQYDIAGMFGAIGCIIVVAVLFFRTSESLENWLKSRG